MKITKYANRFVFLPAILAGAIFLSSCQKVKTSPSVAEPEPEPEVPAVTVEEEPVKEPEPVPLPPPVVEEREPEIEVVSEPVVEPEPEPEPEPVVEKEPEPVVEKKEPPAPPPKPEPAPDDEYLRSVGDVSVSLDTFIDDKDQVLQIISELDEIMKDKNFKAWLNYVDEASISYWRLRKNLQKAEKKLPGKGLIKLQDLQKYFEYVFIPARKGKNITEIRYISDKYIKAVQVQEGQPDIVCYYFNKINGKWLVNLPTNESIE